MSVLFKTQHNIGFIEFDLPDSKVNLLTSEVIHKLDGILDEIKDRIELDAVLIVSKKKDIFIAGADIKEIENITDPKDGEEKSRAGQNVLNKLEDLKVPTVAVINGVALGGGCELALACRYRVATFSEKVKIGLPEVNLGIIPGFGGTFRLPKVIGLMQALKLITSGKPVSGRDALKIGLVDQLFTEIGLEESLRQFVQTLKAAPENLRSRKKQTPIQRFLEGTAVGQAIVFAQTRKVVLKLSKGFYPAPLKAVEVIRRTLGKNRQEALNIEAKAFSTLAVTEISKNLVKVFYLSEQYKRLSLKDIEGRDSEGVIPKTVSKCAVVGAGIMGGGIAQILGYKDIRVRMKDIRYEAVAHGLKTAAKIFGDAVKKRKLSPAQARAKMACISGTLDYSGFQTADVVIEAVIEDMAVKKKVLGELDGVSAPSAVFCTNTSALSVTEMAQATLDPSRVIGLHFFNPVHRMPLVEIIRTEFTSPQTLATTLNLAKLLGKTPVVVKDSRGFLVNRILLAYINEAGRMLQESGEVELLDNVITHFGLPMGPFELSDEVGLDVGIKVLHILQEAFGERFKPVRIFEEIYQKGILGKKTGKGFYLHQGKREMNPELLSLIRRQAPRVSLDDQDCVDRMILIMVNEAARCLEERVVDDPGAVDIAMILGTGFPPFRGGLLRYADSLGVATVIQKLQALDARFNDGRFKPAPYILDLKDKNRKFYGG